MKKVKFGVIGAGGIADRRTLPGMILSEKCKLVAVMGPTKEKTEEIGKKYGAKYC